MSLERRSRREEKAATVELVGWVKTFHSALFRVHEILPHPAYGVVIATGFAFFGRHGLQIRSVACLVIAGWLLIDFWAWWLPKKDKIGFKLQVGATVTSAGLIAVMAMMFWWMDGELSDQRDNVYQGLKVQIQMASFHDAEAAMDSTVEIVNDSNYDIGWHKVWCRVRRVAYEDHSYIEGPAMARSMASEAPLKAGGDGQTDSCMYGVKFSDVMVSGAARVFKCADVTVHVEYFLASQPSVHQYKDFRFVANRRTHFDWRKEPIEAQDIFCTVGGPDG